MYTGKPLFLNIEQEKQHQIEKHYKEEIQKEYKKRRKGDEEQTLYNFMMFFLSKSLSPQKVRPKALDLLNFVKKILAIKKQKKI